MCYQKQCLGETLHLVISQGNTWISVLFFLLFIPRRTKNSYRLAQIKMHDINVALSGPVSFVLFLAKHASLLFSSAFPSAECEGLLSLLVIRLTKGNSG